MIELGANEERLIQNFEAMMADVRTPGDMFPPDEPDNEVLGNPEPKLPPLIGHECLRLAKVYDLQQARRRRLLGESTVLLAHIDDLLPA